MIAREIVGSGYVGSGLAFGCCLLALRRPVENLNNKKLLVIWITIPILLSLSADAAFGYFVAIRQFVFVLPAVGVLVCLGIQGAGDRYGASAAKTLTALVIAVNLVGAESWFTRPREDWNKAALALNGPPDPHTCIEFLPGSSADLYRVFVPALTNDVCNLNDLTRYRHILVAIAPFASQDAIVQQTQALARFGFRFDFDMYPGQPRVRSFTK